MLKLNEEERPKEMFVTWSQNIYNNRINELINNVQDLKTKFQLLIGELELTIEHFESSYDSELTEWQNNVEEKRYKLQILM